jgi:hypothetical protein
MSIKLAKLITGEIIIGDVVNTGDQIEFNNLVQISLTPVNEKSVRIGFFPLHPFALKGDKTVIKENHILLWISNYPADVVKEYEAFINPPKIITLNNNIVTPH